MGWIILLTGFAIYCHLSNKWYKERILEQATRPKPFEKEIAQGQVWIEQARLNLTATQDPLLRSYLTNTITRRQQFIDWAKEKQHG